MLCVLNLYHEIFKVHGYEQAKISEWSVFTSGYLVISVKDNFEPDLYHTVVENSANKEGSIDCDCDCLLYYTCLRLHPEEFVSWNYTGGLVASSAVAHLV